MALSAEERDDGPGDAHVAEEIDLEHFVDVGIASCMSAQLFSIVVYLNQCTLAIQTEGRQG